MPYHIYIAMTTLENLNNDNIYYFAEHIVIR